MEQAALRPARPEDIDALLSLERQATTAAHWSRAQYEAIFRPDAISRLCLIGENQGLRGFLLAQTSGPEWELENIVVAPSARRQGMATQLLRGLVREARERRATAVLLEVRASNAAARSLYQSCGFLQTGVRPRYYQQPQEDAVIYRFDLEQAS